MPTRLRCQQICKVKMMKMNSIVHTLFFWQVVPLVVHFLLVIVLMILKVQLQQQQQQTSIVAVPVATTSVTTTIGFVQLLSIASSIKAKVFSYTFINIQPLSNHRLQQDSKKYFWNHFTFRHRQRSQREVTVVHNIRDNVNIIRHNNSTSSTNVLKNNSSSSIDIVATQQQQQQQQTQERRRRIPSMQRMVDNTPRPARRLNHAFKYLYRWEQRQQLEGNNYYYDYDNNNNNNNSHRSVNDTIEFLIKNVGYTYNEIIQMNHTFPQLLSLSIEKQFYPTIQFLKYTLLRNFSSTESTTWSNQNIDVKKNTSFFSLLLLLSFSSKYQNDLNNHDRTTIIPPYYYSVRLEKILAPRHAFLVWSGLPCGIELFQQVPNNEHQQQQQHLQFKQRNNNNNTLLLFHQFLSACQNTNEFVLLCQQWQQQQQKKQQTMDPMVATGRSNTRNSNNKNNMITIKHIEAFDTIFSKGIMAAVRNEMIQPTTNTWVNQYIPNDKSLTSGQLVKLLLQHGACITERDHRGATLLHWACGTGTMDVVQVLLQQQKQQHHQQHHQQQQQQQQQQRPDNVDKKKEDVHNNNNVNVNDNNSLLVPLLSIDCMVTRDDSTPLHWAAAGCTGREFGTGGHVTICQLLLEQYNNNEIIYNNSNTNHHHYTKNIDSYVNAKTKDGNTPLMWAAWSNSFHIVQYLVEKWNASTTCINDNGCTIAHWAASSGNVTLCQYLYEYCHVPFDRPNYANNTPLLHAVAFGKMNVVEWLLQLETEVNDKNNNNNKTTTKELLKQQQQQHVQQPPNSNTNNSTRQKLLMDRATRTTSMDHDKNVHDNGHDVQYTYKDIEEEEDDDDNINSNDDDDYLYLHNNSIHRHNNKNIQMAYNLANDFVVHWNNNQNNGKDLVPYQTRKAILNLFATYGYCCNTTTTTTTTTATINH